MRLKGDIQKVNSDPAENVPGTDGLFSLVIKYSENTSSIDE